MVCLISSRAFSRPAAVVLGADVALDPGVDGGELGLLEERALGVVGDELVVVERGRLVVAAGHVLVGDLEHGVVGERAGRVVVADVLEGLQAGAARVDQRLLAGEPGVPGQLLLGLGLGVALAPARSGRWRTRG